MDGRQWFLEELTERSGDGPPKRPDAVNTYSRVTIVKNTPEEVVVHWRYLPKFEGTNPHFNKTNLPYHGPQAGGPVEHLVTTTAFVDEYFTVRPDGSVTRTFRRGTERYEDWIDPANQLTQELALVHDGIRVERVTEPRRSRSPERLDGALRREAAVVDPVRWWTFDEGLGDTVRERVTGVDAQIQGPRSYWKRGVSGTCLAFDGYTSAVRLPAAHAPDIDKAVTLEGWVAPGAYPWNWTPVVQQGHEDAMPSASAPTVTCACRWCWTVGWSRCSAKACWSGKSGLTWRGVMTPQREWFGCISTGNWQASSRPRLVRRWGKAASRSRSGRGSP